MPKSNASLYFAILGSLNSGAAAVEIPVSSVSFNYPLIKQTGKSPDSSLTSEWLDSEQAAAYLKISVGSLRNMTSNGQLPYHKLGKRNRYQVEELKALLLSQSKGVRNGN